MKKNYKITLSGCDDSNEITVSLTEKEKFMLDFLANKFNRPNMSGCVPTFNIELEEKKQ